MSDKNIITEEEMMFVSLADRIEHYRDISNIDWSTKYTIIFDGNVNKRIHKLANEIGIDLDYYDPDTTYEDDVNAFVNKVVKARDEIINKYA